MSDKRIIIMNEGSQYISGDNAEVTLLGDGTLQVKVADIDAVSRVMVKDDSVFCKMFYEDCEVE